MPFFSLMRLGLKVAKMRLKAATQKSVHKIFEAINHNKYKFSTKNRKPMSLLRNAIEAVISH